MQHQIKTLTILFRNRIAPHEIPLFRGAVIGAVGNRQFDIFHNHRPDEGLLYRYPLIQYKTIQGKAAIVCVGEGVDALEAILVNCNGLLHIGERSEQFEVVSAVPQKTSVETWDDLFEYTITNWLPLNKENYQQYCQTEELGRRIEILEKMLVGNILSACKGMGVRLLEQVRCQILTLSEPRKTYYKRTAMLRFDSRVRINVTLPDNIGLGKGASLGHGTITMIINQ